MAPYTCIKNLYGILLWSWLGLSAPLYAVISFSLSSAIIEPYQNALIATIQRGDSLLLPILLQQGMGINTRNAHGDTLLMIAVDKEFVDIVKILLRYGSDIHASNNNGDNALLLAAYIGNLELVKLLLQAGGDINGANNLGITPLLAAVDKKQNAIAHLLIQEGADVHACNKENLTALLYAADRGLIEIAALLLERQVQKEVVNENGDTPLLLASLSGHTEIVKLLLDYGANIHARNSNGDTALTLAADHGYIAIVEMLLSAGADIDAGTINGDTSLMLAISKSHWVLVELLLQKGADRGMVQHNGLKAWHCAVAMQHYRLARLLQCPWSDFVLARKAINARRLADVRYFIEERALSTQETDRHGVTLLAQAASVDSNKIVLYLLSKGANPFATKQKGWTPLQLALNHSAESLSAKVLERVMIKREVDASLHGEQLCAQESAAHTKESSPRKINRSLPFVRSIESEGHEGSWTDEDDCDAYYIAECRKDWQVRKHEVSSMQKKSPTKKSNTDIKAFNGDAYRKQYEPRVKEWFDTPERALSRAAYIRFPETLFPEIIFRHTIAQSIDTLTRQWAVYDSIGINKQTALLYCIIMRYGRQEKGIVEYGIDTKGTKPLIYHRFLNKVEKHPDCASRFIVPQHITPSCNTGFRTGSSAHDGSYIVQITTESVEVYDPKNEATFFVCKPKA